jgi:hypothetical protein
MQFTPLSFSTPAKPGESVKGGFVTRTALRRMARLKTAEAALPLLPEEGQTLHGLMCGSYDLMHLLIVLLDKLGPCDQMQIATLSLSARNVTEMAAFLDASRVRHLSILVSDFFRRHDKVIFTELVAAFSKRNQRVAAARSHCKIVTLALEDGRRFTLEGSANLRTNSNIEQFALTQGVELYEWYSTWISEMVAQHEVRQDDD